MLNIEWLGKVWFQSTEWQRSPNVKLRAQRLACTLFEIGELKETSVEKILTFWGYQIHCCSLSQELEKTHSETCTIQSLCIGEKSCSLSSGKKKTHTFSRNQANEPSDTRKENLFFLQCLQSSLLANMYIMPASKEKC